MFHLQCEWQGPPEEFEHHLQICAHELIGKNIHSVSRWRCSLTNLHIDCECGQRLPRKNIVKHASKCTARRLNSTLDFRATVILEAFKWHPCSLIGLHFFLYFVHQFHPFIHLRKARAHRGVLFSSPLEYSFIATCAWTDACYSNSSLLIVFFV